VPPAVSAATQDTLRLALAGPARVRTGEHVTFTLVVRNGTGRPMDLYLRGRTPTMDLVVETVVGAVVWRQLEGAIIPAIALLHQLPAEGQLEVPVTWDQRTREGAPVGPGRYRVRGSLLVETGLMEAPPAMLEISPP
jgi:hypothetical protein